jgi:hypothetical protein
MVWAAHRGTAFVATIIIPHVRITVMEYEGRLGNEVHLMIHTLFPKNNALFQRDNAPIHTAGTFKS